MEDLEGQAIRDSENHGGKWLPTWLQQHGGRLACNDEGETPYDFSRFGDLLSALWGPLYAKSTFPVESG